MKERPIERPAPGRIGWTVTGGFLVFTLLAVTGYATFGLHPERLPESDLARSLYAVSFRRFAQLQIILAFLAVAIGLQEATGTRWVPAVILVSGVAFLAEHVGTGFGFPFGGYRYTGLLGPRLGGRVPILVPLSWFVMAVPSFGIASRFLPGSRARWKRIGIATALLVAWDLALDPAMSFLTPYWIWEAPGLYYGMPWLNLAGWTVTGLAIMMALEILGAQRWMAGLSVSWFVALYSGVLFMPLGMVAAAGHWLAVMVTLFGVGVAAGLLVLGGRPLSSSPTDEPAFVSAPATSTSSAGSDTAPAPEPIYVDRG